MRSKVEVLKSCGIWVPPLGSHEIWWDPRWQFSCEIWISSSWLSLLACPGRRGCSSNITLVCLRTTAPIHDLGHSLGSLSIPDYNQDAILNNFAAISLPVWYVQHPAVGVASQSGLLKVRLVPLPLSRWLPGVVPHLQISKVNPWIPDPWTAGYFSVLLPVLFSVKKEIWYFMVV